MKIESIFKSQKIQILINLDNKDEFKIKISEITLVIRTNKLNILILIKPNEMYT